MLKLINKLRFFFVCVCVWCACVWYVCVCWYLTLLASVVVA